MSQHTYPQSLKHQNDYLKRVNSALRETLERMTERIDTLTKDNQRLFELTDESDDKRGVWFFQNDGYDNIASMANDLQVLITAADLKHLLNHGECVAEDI